MILQAKNISKLFGNNKIISDLTFSLNKGEKLALIGKNGVGKTTLLNIIAGKDLSYSGTITKTKDISYIEQNTPIANTNKSIFEYALSSFYKVLGIKKQIEELEKKLIHSNEERIKEKYGRLLHEFESQGGYEIENKTKKVLEGLGFQKDEWDKHSKLLSGGEIRRVSLAKMLLSNASLLLLDEPTNHLDIFSIKWLENLLKSSSKQTMIIVSHDKYFINNIANKTIELPSNLIYHGNYDFYLKEKELLYKQNEKEYTLEQKKLEKEKEFIRRNIAGQKTRQAKSRRKAIEKIVPVKLIEKDKAINISFSDKVSSIIQLVKINNFSKAFQSKTIIDRVSLSIEKGDKIGLIGKNASGKTTLIKAVLQEENDRIYINKGINISYFAQHNKENFNKSDSVFEAVYNANNSLNRQEIINLLASFQFTGDDLNKNIDYLSGGELTRLSIISILVRNTDLLVLDEPSNHLDILSKDALAMALKSFKGSILCISHDRSFIDQFINKIFLLHKEKLYNFYGNYEDNENNIIDVVNSEKSKRIETKAQDKKPKKKNINIYKLKQTEVNIAKLESEKKSLEEELENPENYTDYKKVQEINKKLKLTEELLNKECNIWYSVQEQ